MHDPAQRAGTGVCSGPAREFDFWPVELRKQVGLGLLHRLGSGLIGSRVGLDRALRTSTHAIFSGLAN